MTTDSAVCTRKDTLLIMMLVMAALAIRLYYLQFYDVVSADGISYITIAKEFIRGNGYSAANHYPPFYPILVGLASLLFNDFETAGLAVSIAMGSLVVVPVYLLGAEFFTKRIGFIASVLSMTWPTLRHWSIAVMSQATYITLLLFGVYFLWKAYQKGSVRATLAAGCCFGSAHLTRSEGVITLLALTVVLILVSLLNRYPARRMLPVAAVWIVFFVVFSPYFYLMHELTGNWQLTGKSRIAIADALSEYLGKPDLKHDPSFGAMGYLDLIRQYPDYIRSNWLKNLLTCWNEMLPVYGWGVVAIGFVVGVRGRDNICRQAYLLATFAPLAFIVVFFFIGPEYTQPYLPVLFLWAGGGLLFLGDQVSRFLHPVISDPAQRVLWYLPVGLVLLFGLWIVVKDVPADRDKPYEYSRDGGRFDDKRIGLRLRTLLPADAKLITRSGRIGFYSDRKYIMPPQTDFAELLSAARQSKIDYLVATFQLCSLRPQWEFLCTPLLEPERPFTPPPELELVHAGQEPGGLPYLLYRFR